MCVYAFVNLQICVLYIQTLGGFKESFLAQSSDTRLKDFYRILCNILFMPCTKRMNLDMQGYAPMKEIRLDFGTQKRVLSRLPDPQNGK